MCVCMCACVVCVCVLRACVRLACMILPVQLESNCPIDGSKAQQPDPSQQDTPEHTGLEVEDHHLGEEAGGTRWHENDLGLDYRREEEHGMRVEHMASHDVSHAEVK